MKNKYRIGEIVLVKGKGKICEQDVTGLGIIKEKDYYFNEYLVEVLSKHIEDWFKEENIEILLERKFKKQEKYKVALAIDIRGLKLIEDKIKTMPNKNNNILKKVSFSKQYKSFKNVYVILVWTETYWSDTNFVVKTIEDSFEELRKNNIAYKQVIVGITDPTFIKINEFISNDSNVDVFNILPKIEIKNMGGILI